LRVDWGPARAANRQHVPAGRGMSASPFADDGMMHDLDQSDSLWMNARQHCGNLVSRVSKKKVRVVWRGEDTGK